MDDPTPRHEIVGDLIRVSGIDWNVIIYLPLCLVVAVALIVIGIITGELLPTMSLALLMLIAAGFLWFTRKGLYVAPEDNSLVFQKNGLLQRIPVEAARVEIVYSGSMRRGYSVHVDSGSDRIRVLEFVSKRDARRCLSRIRDHFPKVTATLDGEILNLD